MPNYDRPGVVILVDSGEVVSLTFAERNCHLDVAANVFYRDRDNVPNVPFFALAPPPATAADGPPVASQRPNPDPTEMADCDHCGDSQPVDDLRDVGNSTMCDSCADDHTSCDDCGAIVSTDDVHTVHNENNVCESCISNNYVYSSPEETYISAENAITLEDSGEHVTRTYARENCHREGSLWYSDLDNIPNRSGGVLDYSDNVLEHCAHDSKGMRDGALLFGVELEMEPQEGNSQEEVSDALGGPVNSRYILKDDGSLDNGVEIVTVPLSLEDHATAFNWKDVLRPTLDVAKSGANTTHCGMHVHINKAALSALQIGKMLVFLNSEDQTTRRHVTMIAQRGQNTYCQRSEKKITDGKHRSAQRYDIANVGPHTVEIRMFKGNLRHERILKNIEFCHALSVYVRDASIKTIEHWLTFANWLLERRATYPHLVTFLAERSATGFSRALRPRTNGTTPEHVTCA